VALGHDHDERHARHSFLFDRATPRPNEWSAKLQLRLNEKDDATPRTKLDSGVHDASKMDSVIGQKYQMLANHVSDGTG